MTQQKTQEKKDFNAKICRRIKALRKNLNLTQTDLGKIFNLTPQQAQKYESGKNEISVYYICLFLDYCRKEKDVNYTLDEFISAEEFKLKLKM
jgi:transcriptional regulator with XRE-family HTH domain